MIGLSFRMSLEDSGNLIFPKSKDPHKNRR